MTASAALATSGSRSLGEQRPRLRLVPVADSSTGDEAIALGRVGGIVLDPWQEFSLRSSLAESSDWKCSKCAYEAPAGLLVPCPTHPRTELIHPWAVQSFGLVVPRQNGKNEVAIVRELTGLLLLGERKIIHCAHRGDTAIEHMERMKEIVLSTPSFKARLRGGEKHGIRTASGREAMLFDGPNGPAVIFFKTRVAGSGRGYSADLLVLDEAYNVSDAFLGGLLPTLSARPNPQVWFASSAVNKRDPDHVNGLVLSRLRGQAIAAIEHERTAEEEDLAYCEWSIDAADPDLVDDEVLDDPENLAIANPSLGIHLSRRRCRDERRKMSKRHFAVERLGIGDWFEPDGFDGVIRFEDWKSLGNPNVEAENPIVFAFDRPPAGTTTTIAAAAWTEDRRIVVDIVGYERGVEWVAEDLVGLKERNSPVVIVFDSSSSYTSSVVPRLKEAGLRIYSGRGPVPRGGVMPMTAAECAQGASAFLDLVGAKALVHHGVELGYGPKLAEAVVGARKKENENGFRWSRKDSTVDVSPLVAVSNAVFALSKYKPGSASVVDPWEILGDGDDGQTSDDLLEELRRELAEEAEELRREIFADEDPE